MIFNSLFAFNLWSKGQSLYLERRQLIRFKEKLGDSAPFHTRFQHVFVSYVFTALNFLQDPETSAGAFFIHWPLALLHAGISSSNFQAAVKGQTRYCQCYQYSFCLNKTISVAGLNVLDLPSKTKTDTGYPKIR